MDYGFSADVLSVSRNFQAVRDIQLQQWIHEYVAVSYLSAHNQESTANRIDRNIDYGFGGGIQLRTGGPDVAIGGVKSGADYEISPFEFEPGRVSQWTFGVELNFERDGCIGINEHDLADENGQ